MQFFAPLADSNKKLRILGGSWELRAVGEAVADLLYLTFTPWVSLPETSRRLLLGPLEVREVGSELGLFVEKSIGEVQIPVWNAIPRQENSGHK